MNKEGNYIIQQNLCKKLLRKIKKSYLESLNTKTITDNRTYWKTVVLLFTEKASGGEKIILTEAEEHIPDDKNICKIFNNFFSNVISDLKIPDYYNYRWKNTSVFSILKKGNLIQYFHSERLLRKRY